jgi:hypothetical protein
MKTHEAGFEKIRQLKKIRVTELYRVGGFFLSQVTDFLA